MTASSCNRNTTFPNFALAFWTQKETHFLTFSVQSSQSKHIDLNFFMVLMKSVHTPAPSVPFEPLCREIPFSSIGLSDHFHAIFHKLSH